MKVYGDLDMLGGGVNKLKKARFGLLPEFPDVAKIGNLVFKDKKLYIYAEINTLAAWLPITSEVLYHSQAIGTPATTWVITHGMAAGEILIQCYDADNKWIVPDDIDNGTIGISTITFLQAMAGRVFIVQRTINADRISVFAVDEHGNFVTDSYGNYVVVG
jgi:hypothetical protein